MDQVSLHPVFKIMLFLSFYLKNILKCVHSYENLTNLAINILVDAIIYIKVCEWEEVACGIVIRVLDNQTLNHTNKVTTCTSFFH